METTINTNALLWLCTSFTYAFIIILVIFLATRKIRKLHAKLQDSTPGGVIQAVQHLLRQTAKDLPPGDFDLVLKRANQLPVILKHGEFSYIRPLEKIIFTENPKP
jgi:hypothetical protein